MEKSLFCLNKAKVSVLGLSSLFSRLTSFLLKQSPHVSRLALYDDLNPDAACDLSNINTQCKIRSYVGQEQLSCAVKDSDVVLIGDQDDVCGMVPFHKRNLEKESCRLLEYARAIADHSPCAIVLVAASPVNSLLPLVSEYLIDYGVFDCNKVLGVTTVDNVRANTLAAKCLNLEPSQVVLPVLGGSSPDTRVPVFSQARPCLNLSKKQWLKMTWEIKNSEYVIRRIQGRSESLNKAYATVRFVHSVLAGLRGEQNVAEIALARTILVPDTPYFALPVILGPEGIKYRFNLPAFSPTETILIEHAAKCMNRDVETGLKYLGTKYFKNEKVNDARGLVGHIMSKICGIGEKHINKKPEYLLLTNKKCDLNPDFRPCEHPVSIPFVVDDCCDAVALPVPPSFPRKAICRPPKCDEDKCDVKTPFAPIISKEGEKFKYCQDDDACCSKPFDNCTRDFDCCDPYTWPERKTLSLNQSNEMVNLVNSKSLAEERKKIKAQKLAELRKREEVRRASMKSKLPPPSIQYFSSQNKDTKNLDKKNSEKSGGKMSEEQKRLCKMNECKLCKNETENNPDANKEKNEKNKNEDNCAKFSYSEWPYKYGTNRTEVRNEMKKCEKPRFVLPSVIQSVTGVLNKTKNILSQETFVSKYLSFISPKEDSRIKKREYRSSNENCQNCPKLSKTNAKFKVMNEHPKIHAQSRIRDDLANALMRKKDLNLKESNKTPFTAQKALISTSLQVKSNIKFLDVFNVHKCENCELCKRLKKQRKCVFTRENSRRLFGGVQN